MGVGWGGEVQGVPFLSVSNRVPFGKVAEIVPNQHRVLVLNTTYSCMLNIHLKAFHDIL